jgi:hypothetical protein
MLLPGKWRMSFGEGCFPRLSCSRRGLHAETFIGPAGIASSTLRTIPDIPVGTFELTLSDRGAR